MAETLKLRDADQKVRAFFNARRSSAEECVVHDENDQTVAVLLPWDRYRSYQSYLRQREQDFAIFDALDEKMKGQDPDEVQARIDKAVEEVKAASREAPAS